MVRPPGGRSRAGSGHVSQRERGAWAFSGALFAMLMLCCAGLAVFSARTIFAEELPRGGSSPTPTSAPTATRPSTPTPEPASPRPPEPEHRSEPRYAPAPDRQPVWQPQPAPKAESAPTGVVPDPRPPQRSTTTTAPPPGTTTAPPLSPEQPTSPAPPPAATPSKVTKLVVVTEPIPFRTRTVKDPELPNGERQVRTEGRQGVKAVTYQATYTGGKRIDLRFVGERITRRPVIEVVAVGTGVGSAEPACDPDYSGCVPVADDVDCAGGGGDGPAYVTGPVRVIGADSYELDDDGDGLACEE